MKQKLLLLLFISVGLIVHAENIVISTTEINLPSDGKTLCTDRLQKTIDKISDKGGGILHFTPGTYLSGCIVLKNNVILQLDKGATILGSPNPYDYISIKKDINGEDKRSDNASMALIVADNAHNIAIRGAGTLDGNGLQVALNADSLHHTGEYIDSHYNMRRQRTSELVRPKLMFFSECNDIKLEGFYAGSSANWGLSFDRCRNLTLQNITIKNRAYWNNDGIDITDCSEVLVKKCHIDSVDDGICLKSYHKDSANKNIHITDCDISSSASAVKFGTGSWGGFHDIEIDNIRIHDTFRSAIAIESVDGAQIENIHVHDIHAENTGNAIFIRLGQRAGDRKGSIRNIVIRNLYCQVPFGRPDKAYDLRGPEVDFLHNPFPGSICGIPGNRIENVVIENVEIEYPGRATKGMAYMPLWRAGDVPEQIGKYPEFSMFGELPAYGFYLRHIDGITFRNVRLTLKDYDFRPAYVAEDVSGIKFDNVIPNNIFTVK